MSANTSIVAKSVVTMDVKPWDDETDMNQLLANVRAIEKGKLYVYPNPPAEC